MIAIDLTPFTIISEQIFKDTYRDFMQSVHKNLPLCVTILPDCFWVTTEQRKQLVSLIAKLPEPTLGSFTPYVWNSIPISIRDEEL